MPPARPDFIRDLLLRNPGLHAARAAFAESLLERGDIEQAAAESATALAGDPTLIQAWLVHATAERSLGRVDAAANDLLQAAVLAPDRPMILVNLANAYAETDRLGAAEICLRRAVAIAPDCLEALAGLGSVLVRLGRLAEAEAPCLAALALDPGLVRAHQNLSGILADSDPSAARMHRDAAYRRQQVFVEHAARAELAILVLAAADSANVPVRHLMPGARYTLVHWYIEYAVPDQDHVLPPFDLVFNAIGDPDLAPAIPPPAARLIDNSRDIVLNHPANVAATRRSDLPGRLTGIAGLIVPPVIRLNEYSSAIAAASVESAMAFPILLRPLGSHGGVGVRKVGTADAFPELSGPSYATQFVDFASPDGWYRKYRAIFVDGRPYPYHLAISRDWLVHYWTAAMEGDALRQAEERRFLDDPAGTLGEGAMQTLAAVAQRLGLDYGGIDFGLLQNGDIVVFEANATMLVHPEPPGDFAYRNPAVDSILDAFRTMLASRAARAKSAGHPARGAKGGIC